MSDEDRAKGPSALQLGAWIVNGADNSLSRDGETRHVQPLSMNILLYLAEHADRVVTSDELIGHFWKRRIVGDDAVHRRIADLRKKLGDDAREPTYIRTISKRGYQLVAKAEWTTAARRAPAQRRSMPVRRIVATISVLLILVFALWAGFRDQTKPAFTEALNSATALLAEDRYQEAYFAIAPFADRTEPAVTLLLNKLLLPISVYTEPAGVDVAYRYALPDAEWVSLGKTPVTGISLPRGHYQLRLADNIIVDDTHPGVSLNSAERAQRIIRMPVAPVPADMVFIPAGKYRLGVWGFVEELDLGGFLIDRFEVSNRDYRDFVAAGGYREQRYWQTLIDQSEGKLTWPGIQERFVDSTGHPGPADWAFGNFGTGEQNLPVTGISWYEANTYLAFRDKRLPSVHHWLRAALGPMEWRFPFAPYLVPRSNLSGTMPLPVDRQAGSEINGASDLIGNVAEWTSTQSRGARAVVGASFRDPAWAYNFPQPLDPAARNETTGFRGIRLVTDSVASELPTFDLFNDFSATVKQVSDDVFEGIAHNFSYLPGMVTAADVSVVEETEFENWTRREILIPTGRDDDPMPVYLFIPRHFSPPYQSVIYLPPADSWSPGFRSQRISLDDYQIDFVPRSGRVLIWPVYTGSHERYDNYHDDPGPERSGRALERNRRIRDEIGRVIDYLESEPLFDGSRVALMGLSHGATLAPFSLATEPRLKAAVLYSVGIAPPIPIFANPQNDPNVFWARVRQPVIIINGRYDPIRPYQFVLQPLLDLLATPAGEKSSLLYESGHWPLPRNLMMRDTTAWLDKTLGPAGQPVTGDDEKKR